MKMHPLTPESVLHVATNMREADHHEIFATRWDNDPLPIVNACLMCGDISWVAAKDEPIAVIGAIPIHPGVWQAFLFATDRFNEISLSLTTWVKRVMMPTLFGLDIHRCECKSMASHAEAHRWLEYLGWKRESTIAGYGRGGEDFYYYVWSR